MTTPKVNQLLFLGTGTSHGVPVIGCRCAVCTSSNVKNCRTRCSVVFGLPEGNLLIDTTPELRVQLLREDVRLIHANQIPPEILRLLTGLDLLVLDALRRRPHPTHFSLDEAVAVASHLGATRTLFTHNSHDLEHEATNAALPGGMELAYDGLSVDM
jgi:phosphoribosyl 1,2-cyclic phosphodiesterase